MNPNQQLYFDILNRIPIEGIQDHPNILVAAGFWREVAGGYELVGYLEVNRTRAQIAKKMADGRKRTARWRGGQQEPPETE